MDDLCSPLHCNVCLVLRTDPRHEGRSRISLKAFKDLLICSGCQLIRYCSSAHQKVDWPLHSAFCHAVKKVKQQHSRNLQHPLLISEHYPHGPKNRRQLEEVILLLKCNIQNILQRPLKRYEEELVSFPAICGFCLKWRKLTVTCASCGSQAYCSTGHLLNDAVEHERICDLLRLYYCPYKVLQKPLEYNAIQPSFRRTTFDMRESDLRQLIENLFQLEVGRHCPSNDPRAYQVFSFAAEFSCVATISYCLQIIPEKKLQIRREESLRLYVIGATIEASLWFQEVHTKVFFLIQQQQQQSGRQYKTLELYFIGPELLQTASNVEELNYQLNDSNYTIKYYYIRQCVEEYLQNYRLGRESPSTSSFIVAFNCGFSEYESDTKKVQLLDGRNTWSNGLRKLLELSNIPILFTSFTQSEAECDYKVLENHIPEGREIRKLCKLAKNPYRDLRPLRNWYANDTEQFYYRNGYMQCVEIY